MSNKALDNLITSWMEDETNHDLNNYEEYKYLDENEAIQVCFEDFIKSVKWFCEGIKNGAPEKKTDEKNYSKWLLLEFARRIDKED